MVQGTWYGVRDTHNFWGAPVAQPARTKFGTKIVIVTYSPNRSCVPNLKSLASTVAERSRGSYICSMLPSPDPRQFSSEKLFLGKLLPKSNSCIANLNLLASMAAKINTGVPNFLDAALARTPANFGPKSCFLVSYCPSPTCIPNLKLLASTVAEINRGSSNFFGYSPSQDPRQFWS